MHIKHTRLQHPVGQGGFHSASVQVQDEHGARFRYDYVYDCGALRGAGPTAQLLRCIDRLPLESRPDTNGRPVVNALVLSHYDTDHLNGAAWLKQHAVIRRVIVPHLGPIELVLVLASQAMTLDAAQVQQLHALAHGSGRLLNVPVTQVLPGDGTIDPGTAGSGPSDPADPPRLPDALPGTGGRRPAQGPPPADMTEVEERTGAPLRGTLRPTRAVGLGVPGTSAQAQVWRLKFWNRGTDPRLLGLVTAQLHHIGFPVAAALEPRQATALVDWLNDPAHRKAAVHAYDKAIGLFRPAWAREAQGRRLANFLSLGMYSGVATAPTQPIHRDDTHSGRPFPLLQQVGLDAPESPRLGWLGTGDAPLGEGCVWQDFASHYAQELPLTRTVQVPHHGAAPRNGPAFFHPGLLPEAGMRAVISVGSSNIYGHPKLSVVQACVSAGAQLAIVTEESATPYSESCEFHT